MSNETRDFAFFQQVMRFIENNDFQQVTKTISNYWESIQGMEINSYFVETLKIIEKAMEYKVEINSKESPFALPFQYITNKYCNKSEEIVDSSICCSDIWWCWFQGLDAAPPLVRACYNSLEILNKKVHVITAENFHNYVDIPDFLIDKWKKGIISNTHFSDILRLELLTKRGGVWIDATVLVTGNNIMKYIEQPNLFVFKHIMRGEASNYLFASNWLLGATHSSQILNDTKSMLYSYWKNENKMINYFLFHLFFTISCYINSDEWEKIPTFSNVPPHILQMELFTEYSEDRWKQLCDMTDIHKLTYKKSRPDNDSFLFIDYIVKQYL